MHSTVMNRIDVDYCTVRSGRSQTDAREPANLTIIRLGTLNLAFRIRYRFCKLAAILFEISINLASIIYILLTTELSQP